MPAQNPWLLPASCLVMVIVSDLASYLPARRAATITFAPSSLKARVVARPIPELPPVTKATLPSNFLSIRGIPPTPGRVYNTKRPGDKITKAE
jgi:hypothetical protein